MGIVALRTTAVIQLDLKGIGISFSSYLERIQQELWDDDEIIADIFISANNDDSFLSVDAHSDTLNVLELLGVLSAQQSFELIDNNVDILELV